MDESKLLLYVVMVADFCNGKEMWIVLFGFIHTKLPGRELVKEQQVFLQFSFRF